MLFGFGTANFYVKTEDEKNCTVREKKEFINEFERKRAALSPIISHVNLIFREKLENCKQKYGSLYEQMAIELKCYMDEDDYFGKMKFRFSNFFKGVHVIYIFDIDKFIAANEETKKKMFLSAASETLLAIKNKKKGDFNAEKLITDITKVTQNLTL